MVQKVLPKGPRVLPPKCDFQKMRLGECYVHILRGPCLMYGLYSRVAYDGARTVCTLYIPSEPSSVSYLDPLVVFTESSGTYAAKAPDSQVSSPRSRLLHRTFELLTPRNFLN